MRPGSRWHAATATCRIARLGAHVKALSGLAHAGTPLGRDVKSFPRGVCRRLQIRDPNQTLIAVTCALVACGTVPAAATPSTPSAAASPALSPANCARGYSETSPTITLANGDDGRSVTVHLCTAIWVALRPGDRGSDWQFVESSDPAVLAVVPLPLPFILGGVESVYLADRIGNAQLSSSRPIASCPPNAMCVAPPRWMVTLAVVL